MSQTLKDKIAAQQTAIATSPAIKEIIAEEEEVAIPASKYQNPRSIRVILSDGTTMKPETDGGFIPSNEDEQAHCDHFVSTGHLTLFSGE